MGNTADEITEQTQAMNKLLLEIVKTQKSNTKSLIKVFIATIICYTVLLLSLILGFFWYESQFETSEKTIEEKTITQEVSGENSEINNVEGSLYKDSAVHNERRAE